MLQANANLVIDGVVKIDWVGLRIGHQQGLVHAMSCARTGAKQLRYDFVGSVLCPFRTVGAANIVWLHNDAGLKSAHVEEKEIKRLRLYLEPEVKKTKGLS